MKFKPSHKGAFYVCVTLSIWALFAVFSRMLGTQHLNSWDLTFIRFGTALSLLMLYMLYRRQWVSFKFGQALILSVFGGAGYCAIVYTGFLYAPVSHSAIWLNACIPVSTFLLTWLFLRSSVQRADAITVAIIAAAIGAMLSYGLSSGSYHFSIGDVLFFSGSMFWASYTLLVRHFKISILEAMTGVTAVSFLGFLPFYLWMLPKNIMQESWQVIAMQGLFHGFFMMILATITFIKSIEYLGPVKAGSVLALAPFLAVFLAIPILGEWPDASAMIGLSGLLLAVLKPWQRFKRS